MSLIKQLWASIVLLVAIAFGVSFVISLWSSKEYLSKELQSKNIDNATSLALSMSQMDKDPVNLELLIAAQFDSGHYQLIRLVSPDGKVMVERKGSNKIEYVPAWFVHAVPIKAHPGIAQVHDGWNQFGSIYLESNTKFAYADLWRSGKAMLATSFILSLISGIAGTFILRHILKPLDNVVSQAEALGERRFIITQEPQTTEFKKLVSAMNRLSDRIKRMLEEESQRLERLRLDTNYDQATKLMNRDYFFNRTQAAIKNDEGFREGVFVVSRIANLTEIDKALGKEQTDALLLRLGEAIDSMTKDDPHFLGGRVAGRDIAVFCAENINAFNLASKINGLLMRAASLHPPAPELQLTTVSSQLKREDTASQLYSHIQGIISDLVVSKAEALHVIGQAEIEQQQDKTEEEWRKILVSALDARRLKLAHFPALRPNKEVIHLESPVRLQLHEGESWVSAGEFISWANRLNLVNRIDLMVVEEALILLKNNSDPIGLNVSGQAMTNPEFVESMVNIIKQSPEVAQQLWLEVPERSAFEHLETFRTFCQRLKSLGCKIGLEHVGAYVSRLGELHDLGLDYIKIDVSVISGIDKNTGNQAFLRGLCLIAHSIGLMTIAEGVQTAEELKVLPALGIDGLTGPAVKTS